MVFIVTSIVGFLPRLKHVADEKWFWLYGCCFLMAVLVGPLTGWLADAKLGNYKVARFGLFLLFWASVFNCLFYVIKPFVNHDLELLELFAMFVRGLLLTGGVCCSFSLFQLGLDQMPDASSSSISSFLTWVVFSSVLGSYLANTLDLIIFHPDCIDISLHYYYTLAWSFILVLCISCVLISDFCLTKKWLIIEPQCPNSLKTIYRVLKFASKHKSPLNRSALTYWEEKVPSRL